jgi:hypothetical protein
MSQEQYSTRLPSDDAKKLEQYCKEKDISKAEALRRSVRELTDEDGATRNKYWRSSVVAGILFVLISEINILPTAIVSSIGIVVLAGLAGALYISWN